MTRRLLLALTLLTMLTAGCSVQVGGEDGATSGSGENSSFTEAGVARIEDEGRAVLDLREAGLSAQDLGAADGERLRDLDVEDAADPVTLVVRGSQGDLEVEARSIRCLVGPEGQIDSVAVFHRAPDQEALLAALEEIGGTVGADTTRVDSFAGSVRSQPEQERDVWVNGADALGFDVGLHPVYAPDADAQVLELQLTPPR